jgi:hypothetical protein
MSVVILLDQLPGEVLVLIAAHLPYHSFCALRLVSRLFCELLETRSLWRSLVQRHVFSVVEEEEESDWKDRFHALMRGAPPPGEYQIFLSLDDLPVVRRTMGLSQVFVLTLSEKKNRLLSCLTSV